MAVASGATTRARQVALGLVLGAMALATACAGSALAAGPQPDAARVVHFRGEAVRVPPSWPVFRLSRRPRMCVRLDRRAVYLGRPGAQQRCPAGAMGRRRAILVDPGARARAARARAQASRVRPAQISAAGDYTGLGFDACSAPPKRTMAAWAESPYRAIGVYIGGVNRGCTQPSLTASWVGEQVAEGWHLIPTYVGLQAPTSSCSSCAKLSPSAATTQGAEAATDAVEEARAVAIGPGSPIYFDMESYSRTASASTATLNFLSAWTTRLHALGYDSGVYSSGASGIADLVDRLGSAYAHPDDLWIANWNGRPTADDPYVPDSAWSEHQRIRQYRGGHDETYGGATINIDNNYVEGATVGTAVAGEEEEPKGHLDTVDSPAPGQVGISGWAFDPNAPTQPLAIRAYVGGKAGQPGAAAYELGPVAVQERSDIALAHRSAGAAHGFDVDFPVAASGRQRVCVYAVAAAETADRALGCRMVGVRVPLVLSRIRATQKAVWMRVSCLWPAGTECPGQILLRGRIELRRAVRRRGRRVVTWRTINTRVAHRTFRLNGGGSHVFSLHLSRRGRLLTRGATELPAKLVVAVPGGRKGRVLTLTPGRGLPK